MAGTIRIRACAEMTSVPGSTREEIVEVDRGYWESMTPEDQQKYLDQTAQIVVDNNVAAWADVIKEDEDAT